MGNVFSRSSTMKDKLLQIENQVIKTEYELHELANASPVYSTIINAVFVVPILSYLSFSYELNLLACFCIATVFLISWYFLYDLVQNKRRAIKTKNLAKLKQERKSLIEKCKNDVNFTITKNLIDRYEDEESRNTFFNQIMKKKRTSLEKASDFVLGNDPSNLNALICTKCGVHNGLVDDRNDEFDFYYCYDCKHKNIRKKSERT